jgi:LemA protein
MNAVAVVLLVVAGLVLLVGIGVAVSYNRFVRQRNLVRESWSQVDVELQRRHDLIPNLVEAVKGYAAHERQVLEAVTSARAAAETTRAQAGDDREQRAGVENALNRAVVALIGVAERYPDLRASENFLALQEELVDTEDRIAAGRRFYNGNVRALNTRVEAFPSALVARAFGFTTAAYFPLDDPGARAAVAVAFGHAERGADR